MPDLAGKRYWLVGASEGLGRALAQALDAEGAGLVVSARSADRLDELARDLGDAHCLPLDVTDAQSVADAVDSLPEIDGIIYAAGAYEPMTADEWEPEAAALMGEVNFVGALRVLGHIVPRFARAGAGHVVLIGSLSGFGGLPGAIGYGSSKAGLMHLAENLRIDLRDAGVVVQRVNPGFIRTRLSDKNDFRMPQIMAPEDAAGRVVAAMKRGRFSTSFPIPFAWLFTVGRHLPVSWFQRIFA